MYSTFRSAERNLRCVQHFYPATQVQDILLEYGLENVAEILIEGLSRVKRCTDEGRALMSLDLQVGGVNEDASVFFWLSYVVILIVFFNSF